MLLKPLANARHRTLVGVGGRMRAMEDANFLKQDHSHTAAFSLADLCAKLYEERLNIAPPDVAARRTSEHQFEGALMLSFHGAIVPLSGTDRQVLRRLLTSDLSGAPLCGASA